ncbi:hypothetical protein AB1Y20_008978 [Prymnesium parvum]|uniref:Transmembrane protein 175 n=1 Tax=Prymnesium parvum TaxID=97485 RepID=A0AB34K3C0_PRYPA
MAASAPAHAAAAPAPSELAPCSLDDSAPHCRRHAHHSVVRSSIKLAGKLLKSRNRIAHPGARRLDLRETAARFNFPSQRQVWVATADGQLVNSADGVRRAIPAYMLCVDLVFAAAFNSLSQMLVADLRQFHFFCALFLPIWWLWQHLNYLFNRFDPEDISSEILIIAFSSGLLAASQAAQTCSWSSPLIDANDVAGDAGCRYFVISFFALRVLLTLYTVYICWHVRQARRLLFREALYIMLLTPFIAFVAATQMSAYDPWFWPLWLAMVMLDNMVFVLLPVALAWLKESERCTRVVAFLEIQTPPNVSYMEARYERMVTIAIGTVVAGALKQLDQFNLLTLLECLFVPWVAFLIKVFYFDLSPGLASSNGIHATRVSTWRGAAWAYLHGPIIGSVLWVNASISGLISVAGADDADAASTRKWSFVGAFTSFVVLCSAQQALHQGSGKGHRRIGATRRKIMRLIFIGILCSFPLLPLSAPVFQLVAVLLLTLLTSIELWGRGFNIGGSSSSSQSKPQSQRATFRWTWWLSGKSNASTMNDEAPLAESESNHNTQHLSEIAQSASERERSFASEGEHAVDRRDGDGAEADEAHSNVSVERCDEAFTALEERERGDEITMSDSPRARNLDPPYLSHQSSASCLQRTSLEFGSNSFRRRVTPSEPGANCSPCSRDDRAPRG